MSVSDAFDRPCPRCGEDRTAADFFPGGYSVCRECCLGAGSDPEGTGEGTG